jgi:hypothetical protein
MRINLHIERLVLEGFSLTHQERSVLHAAVQAELSRLLSGANAFGESPGTATPVIRAPGLSLESKVGPASLGRQIAESVHASITR